MDSNPMDNEFLPTVPPLPERWQERNQGAVKERLYAAKELYAALANHEWIDVCHLARCINYYPNSH